MQTDTIQEELKAGQETLNTVYEEIKEEDKLRRWNQINFSRRIRAMAKAYVGQERDGLGCKIDTSNPPNVKEVTIKY